MGERLTVFTEEEAKKLGLWDNLPQEMKEQIFYCEQIEKLKETIDHQKSQSQ